MIGFTVETDGRLPSGDSIEQAIDAVDAATDGAARSFMINCAHPTHFADALPEGECPPPDPRPARERVDEKPRGTRRGRGTRRRRPRESGRALRRASAPATGASRARRLLWHRHPTRDRDLRRLAGCDLTRSQAAFPKAGAGDETSVGAQMVLDVPRPELDNVAIGIGDVKSATAIIVLERDDFRLAPLASQSLDRGIETRVVDVHRVVNVNPAPALRDTDLGSPETDSGSGAGHQPHPAALIPPFNNGETQDLE